jgi:hypothetical protein
VTRYKRGFFGKKLRKEPDSLKPSGAIIDFTKARFSALIKSKNTCLLFLWKRRLISAENARGFSRTRCAGTIRQ